MPGSSVHGILQARILEWVAISFSRGSSWPRDRTQVFCIAGRLFTIWASREAYKILYICLNKETASLVSSLKSSLSYFLVASQGKPCCLFLWEIIPNSQRNCKNGTKNICIHSTQNHLLLIFCLIFFYQFSLSLLSSSFSVSIFLSYIFVSN